MDKPVVVELIQNDLNEKRLREELDKLLNDNTYRTALLKDYDILWHKLGDMPASDTAAKEIIDFVK